jgi:hypothetical protein
MTVRNADSQCRLLMETRPAVTDRLGGRCFWKEFLMALLRAMSAWTV